MNEVSLEELIAASETLGRVADHPAAMFAARAAIQQAAKPVGDTASDEPASNSSRQALLMMMSITLVRFDLHGLIKGLGDGETFEEAMRKTISGERLASSELSNILDQMRSALKS